MTVKNKLRDKSVGLIILAIAFLVNPVVRVVDILPDFIACYIISKYLAYPANRVPYFEESRQAFIKLGFTSLAKIPAFFIISYARSVNVADYDTGVLLTFAFSVIEAILFYFAIKNLFLGIFYLGERSDAEGLIAPFQISKRGRTMTPELLEISCFVYAVLRCALTAAPEMLLLSHTTDGGAHLPYYNPARLYPYTIILTVIGTFVLAVVFGKRAVAYVRAVAKDGRFKSACDSLIAPGREEELERKCISKEVRFGLSLMTVASVFTLDLCFDNFNDVNLLPHFIYGGMLIGVLWCVRRRVKIERGAYIVLAVFCAVSLVTYAFEIHFLDTYGYEALVKDAMAKAAYIPVIICASIEMAAQAVAIFFLARFLLSVFKEHTGIMSSDEQSSSHRQAQARKTRIKVYIWGGFAALSGLSKLADTVQRYFSDLTLVATDGGIGNVVSGLIPWFGLIVLLCSGMYIGYSMYLFSHMRDEIEIKYS